MKQKLFYYFILCLPGLAFCSDQDAPHLIGADLSFIWVIPFVGILLSIAIFPLIAPYFWHKNFGKVSLFWASLLIISLLAYVGLSVTVYELLHVALLEYIPFIILLLALFTISGGVRLTGTLVGKPITNTLIIFVGTIFASWMGTTGAAMLLIRPLIRANSNRNYKVHTIVFFIFLVANIGGSLTPLGDPPLFLGFLKGVDFFWTTKALLEPMLVMVVCLLIIYFVLDTYLNNKEDPIVVPEKNYKIGLEGTFNLLLLGGIILSVLMSGFWKPHTLWHNSNGTEGISPLLIFGTYVELQNLARDLLLLSLIFISWNLTPKLIREANEFTWFPIVEVAKLFAGIFVTIIPAIAILKAGTHGALSSVIASVSSGGEPVNYMYFWLTGILSSFLDNAPTYLVFFNIAGSSAPESIGIANYLMHEIPNTLLAISLGAVFMGANTYIGNAPNFMVKSIAESSGIEMPSFFGYFFKWALPILIPLFILISFLFF